ncbi:DEAD-box ATP-dependent RNA helicase CshA [Caloramator mitchellensis]|uniref:ATP-dependent RNA helicase CshA n=1 Tax=Caloramator mitchellensis TaxID=908809 RepID=A0A0R3JSQ8_CALMK|nr:DEAD/DEAH box helicase [Caloramator mitchellensis]KRQ86544.1 DEAD-box ATP-dependent RNA helicase CshA [Caloramator mitchellensis]
MEKLKFIELNVSKEILRAIEELGFEEATPIQSRAIPVILEGKDVIGQAQTGTGKTAAFGIPVLEKVDSTLKSLQSIILCPTRELAVQVSEELKKLSKYKRGINVLPIYGGQSIDRQIHALKKGVQIIIGTPGRVIDHLDRGTLKLDNVKMFVLDEADEMLNMGFIEDIEYILEKTPEDKQTVLFSATIPEPILKLTKKYLKNPEYIKVIHKELTVPTIEQGYFEVKEGDKIEVLSRLLDIHNPNLALVFCNTKKKVDDVVNSLQARGYLADALHGDMKQSQRDRVMSKFRNGQIDVLVATDVAARGIDVENVEMVFNYDVPQDEEYYVHRIGRTGRAGKEGRAYSFVAGKEIYKLRDIQRYAKTKIKLLKVPTLHDVEESRANLIIDRIKTTINENNLEKYSDIVERIVGDDYTSLDVAAALLKMVINLDKKADDVDKEFERTGAEPGMVRLFINVGRNQRISPRDIVGAIADKVRIPGDLIGSIDIYEKFSFVEVPAEYAKEVLEIMKDNTIKGKKVNVEVAKGK